MNLIGREAQQETFKHLYNSSESKLLAVYGRRRVGKTFLIRKYFSDRIQFEISGLHHGDMTDQLAHFARALAKFGLYDVALLPPRNWMQAFELLGRLIDDMKGRRKKVIFIDELPWFDTPRSKFLMAFEHFWNDYCMRRSDILMIICGSAASWMIKNILNNKGGLHNRVSERIRLQPFTLHESALFLKEKGIQWSQYDIVQLYMTTGGIPYYLDGVRKGESVQQFIDRACFTPDGLLTNEYHILFESLFDHSEHHYTVIETLNDKKQGLLRSEIIDKTGLSSGGTLTKVIHELTESGFITVSIPYQQNKTKALYKLVDCFSLFYLKYMKNAKTTSTSQWSKIVTSQSWVSWSGLAFERLCYNHIPQIHKALRIEVIDATTTPWADKNKEQGAQIDMLIDRADRVINLCEIKFANSEFTINKSYATNLRNKRAVLQNHKSTKRKNIFLTMITTYGASDNEYYKELIQSEVTMKDLFEK